MLWARQNRRKKAWAEFARAAQRLLVVLERSKRLMGKEKSGETKPKRKEFAFIPEPSVVI